MLVTGGNSDSNYDVEVINLANDGKTCAKPPNYPNRQAHVGMYFDGYPMACGGYITGSNIPRNDCYKYDVQVRDYRLRKRSIHKSIHKIIVEKAVPQNWPLKVLWHNRLLL